MLRGEAAVQQTIAYVSMSLILIRGTKKLPLIRMLSGRMCRWNSCVVMWTAANVLVEMTQENGVKWR